MANINMYDRESVTPGNQNPTPDVIINNETKKEQLPSLLKPLLLLSSVLATWEFLT